MIPVDRDRLRSVQELRCANCRVGVAHCAKRCPAGVRIWLFRRFKKGIQEVRGWGHRAQPAGAGQDAAPGKRERVRPKAAAAGAVEN